MTDRCYLIREGRVFAYGNREQILQNPDVRRHYIGERFDVGHLLDRRRPVSLPHVSLADSPPHAPEESADTTPSAALTSHLVTTDIYASQVVEGTVQSVFTDPLHPEDPPINDFPTLPPDDEWE